MGKMKEVFIKDIEDFGEHREHIDDEYQYKKYLQKKAMKEFKNSIKTLSLVTFMLLTTISYAQVSHTFTIFYDPTFVASIDYELAEGYPITWDHFDNVRHLTGDIVETVYWEATRHDIFTQVDGVWTTTIDGRQYNNLSEFDNKPYVQLEVDAYGGYDFYMYNSQTHERIGTGYFDFFPEP